MKKLLLWAMTASLLAAVVVTVASLLQTPTYEASARLLVSVREESGGELQLIPLAPAPERLRGLVQTMAIAVETRPAAEEAIRRSGLDMPPGMLLTNLTVEQVEGVQVLWLSYTDTDPYRAKTIVNAVGRVAAERITGTGSEKLPLDTELTATVEPATLPDNPVSPKPLRNGLIALVAALALSAVLIEARRRGVWLNEERER